MGGGLHLLLLVVVLLPLAVLEHGFDFEEVRRDWTHHFLTPLLVARLLTGLDQLAEDVRLPLRVRVDGEALRPLLAQEPARRLPEGLGEAVLVLLLMWGRPPRRVFAIVLHLGYRLLLLLGHER